MEIFNIRNILLVVMVVVGFNYYQSKQTLDTQSFVVPYGTKILAFGDSLTAGNGVSKEQSYPAKLSEFLLTEVINEGVSGELSEQGLVRLALVLEKYKPDILILCHGANDILRKRDLVKARKNVLEMVKLAKSKGVFVLLVGVPTYEILSFKTASFYYDIAKEEDIQLEDKALEKIMGDDTLKSDQVHPNAEGYALMARKMAELISSNYFSK